jgi:hypothetical protein
MACKKSRAPLDKAIGPRCSSAHRRWFWKVQKEERSQGTRLIVATGMHMPDDSSRLEESCNIRTRHAPKVYTRVLRTLSHWITPLANFDARATSPSGFHRCTCRRGLIGLRSAHSCIQYPEQGISIQLAAHFNDGCVQELYYVGQVRGGGG